MPLLSLLQLTFFSLGNQVDFGGGESALVISFFKLLFVILGFLYLVFAFVVTRQIKIMRTTLITSFSPAVRLIGFVHLAVAIFVFIALLLFL